MITIIAHLTLVQFTNIDYVVSTKFSVVPALTSDHNPCVRLVHGQWTRMSLNWWHQDDFGTLRLIVKYSRESGTDTNVMAGDQKQEWLANSLSVAQLLLTTQHLLTRYLLHRTMKGSKFEELKFFIWMFFLKWASTILVNHPDNLM